MGPLSFIESIFNVCRSGWDVLHILVYLFVVFIALIAALYQFDINLYNKHVYLPFMKFLIRRGFLQVVNSKKRRALSGPRVYRWTLGSNRLPYIVKAIKNLINKFNK